MSDVIPAAIEDDPVAMALGIVPRKPGVKLPGEPDHCPQCASDNAMRLLIAPILKRLYPNNPEARFGREAREIAAALAEAGFSHDCNVNWCCTVCKRHAKPHRDCILR